MIILSVATHDERMYPIFVQSCARNNLDLRILGKGQKWKGFAWRFDLIRSALKHIDDDEIVLVTDAFDSLVLKPGHVIRQRFLEMGSDIVFGADKVSTNPFIRHYCIRTFLCNKHVCLNGGTYIGYAHAICSLIDRLDYSPNSDDQRVINHYHNKVKKLSYDLNGHLFYFALHFDPDRIKDGQIPDACLISFPGRVVLYKTIERMGYSYGPEQHNNIPPRRKLFVLFLTDYLRFVIWDIVAILGVVVLLLGCCIRIRKWRIRRQLGLEPNRNTFWKETEKL